MRRPFFNFAAAISLLLLVIVLIAWPRSYRKLSALSEADSISLTHQDPLYWIISYPGKAVLCRQVGKDWNGPQLKGFQLMGVKFGGSRGPGQAILWNLELPYWLLALCAMPLLLVRAEVWRRDRKRRAQEQKGCCTYCGYDLRATPGRCPECGREANVTPTIS